MVYSYILITKVLFISKQIEVPSLSSENNIPLLFLFLFGALVLRACGLADGSGELVRGAGKVGGGTGEASGGNGEVEWGTAGEEGRGAGELDLGDAGEFKTSGSCETLEALGLKRPSRKEASSLFISFWVPTNPKIP